MHQLLIVRRFLATLLFAVASSANSARVETTLTLTTRALPQSPGVAPPQAGAPNAQAEIDAQMGQGVDTYRKGDYWGALFHFVQVIAADPTNVNAYNLAANCSRELKDYPSAIDFFKHALQIEPDEFHNVAGLIRVYTLAGMAQERDDLRKRIGVLEHQGKLPANFSFVFETFPVGDKRVEVSEFPQITGFYGDRYHFDVFDGDGKQTFRVALESDALEQPQWAKLHPKEAASGGRLFSLDGYAGKTHLTFRFYDGEPPFQQVREEVEQILAGKTQPVSKSTATSTQPITTSNITGGGTPTSENPPDVGPPQVLDGIMQPFRKIIATSPDPSMTSPIADAGTRAAQNPLDPGQLLPAVTATNTLQNVTRYRPPDLDFHGMNVTVEKSDLGDQFHLQIDFIVPIFQSIDNYNLISIYGLQMKGGKRSDLPSEMFPSVRGNWKAGDRVTFQVNLPKKYSDPADGWNLTFCIGTPRQCVPSPNLLTQMGINVSVAESLNRLRDRLERDSNLEMRNSDGQRQINRYRIVGINNCTITLVHTSFSLDQFHDGGQNTTTTLVNLANLRSDVKVSESRYDGWQPSSGWTVTDNIIDDGTPIPIESIIQGFPGGTTTKNGESHQIEIEFLDHGLAEGVRDMLINAVMSCSEDRNH